MRAESREQGATSDGTGSEGNVWLKSSELNRTALPATQRQQHFLIPTLLRGNVQRVSGNMDGILEMVQGGPGEQEETLFQKVQKMSTLEKIRFALRGDKEARNLLVRDGERTVQLAVFNNPRITEGEIVTIANSRNIHEDVLRKIGTSRDCLRLYPVRAALVQNPKTPLPISLKLLPTLMLKDLRVIAKSKAVPNVIAQAALRLVTKKE